jgi:iron complex outermembrane receptor protein
MKLRVFVVLAARCLWAQQPTAAVSHESVIVTGSAEPIPLEEADRDVSVLPLPPRQRPLFDSWFQLLQTDPSLDVQQRSPGGFIADLSIRGATFGQTLVLLNGMRMSDAQTGHFNLDLPVPIDVISGVEAMKGSGSALYGSDAIGGVINVRTEPFETPDLRLLAGVGNFGTNEEHGVASFRRARASEQLAFARDFSSGFTTDRDYRNLALSSQTNLNWKPGPANLLLALSDRPYGADQFYGNFPSWERIKTWFVSAHQNLGKRTEASVAYRRHTDLFVLFRDNPSLYTNRHLLNSWQGGLRRHEDLPLHGILSYGAEGLGESIRSTNLGVRGRTRGSGYVFYDIRALRRFSLSAGIREEVYGSGQVATSPSLSAAMWWSSRIKIRGSATRAFRLPSFTDLYYSDPANLGNPNLKPESATSYEAGIDTWLHPRLHTSATVFQRRDTNVIDYVRASANDEWQATNFDKLHFTGVEAAVIYEPAAGQRLSASFSALRGVTAGDSILQSKYAFNYPVRAAVVEWRGSILHRVIARTHVGITDRIKRNPYAVWDASAVYAEGHVRPFLEVTNITSTIYQEIPAVAMPKCGVLGGIQVVFYGANR